MKVAKYILYICAVLLATVAWSCERDDDEPRKARKPISRLYVSTSEYVPNSSDAQVKNVFVIDPADSSLFTATGALSYTSGALGGGVVHFSPYAQRIFQASMNTPSYPDTTIQVMSVNDNGQIAASGTIVNRLFTNVKGMAYNSFDDQLFLTNLGSDTVSIFVLNRPKNYRGSAKHAYQIMLDDRVWGMQLDSMDLYLSKTGVNGGILVFKDFVNVINSKQDTLVKDLLPSYTLTVAGTTNIRGFSYSDAEDILVLSDYTGDGVDGRVLIFEGFSKNTSNTTLTPTRVIAGSATKLRQPLDVAIDTREGGRYIYVADVKAKSILRFKVEDNGNVAPDNELSVGNTPQSIFLDSRGPNEF